MSLNLRIVLPTEADEIIEYEKRKLAESSKDETERMFEEWHARWRKESLEHYLKMGWSFIARQDNDKGPIVGYFLAQPLLFLDGQTQSLWVEHLQYSSLAARDELCTLAYKLSREKHFQRIYFPNTTAVASAIAAFNPVAWQSNMLQVKTTK